MILLVEIKVVEYMKRKFPPSFAGVSLKRGVNKLKGVVSLALMTQMMDQRMSTDWARNSVGRVTIDQCRKSLVRFLPLRLKIFSLPRVVSHFLLLWLTLSVTVH